MRNKLTILLFVNIIVLWWKKKKKKETDKSSTTVIMNRGNYIAEVERQPSYAALSMGQFEKEFLDSCDLQPLLRLRFLDDVFMILDDTEEQLLRFLDELNKCLETIKFTFSYSKTDAVLLNVKLEKNDAEIFKLVHMKNTPVFISILSFPLVILCLVKTAFHFSQTKQYRSITSNDECFKQKLEKLETYFQMRNYLADISSEAI